MPYAADADTQPSAVVKALTEAEDALRGGDRLRAHRLSLEAREMAPENVHAWLLCAETSPSREEAVTCLNQAATLRPSDPKVKRSAYQIFQRLLKEDPFVLYLDETENVYRVRSGERLSVTVPKDRLTPEPYPPERPELLRWAYRWLWMAILGLPFAGLGAMVFAPLAAASAIGLHIRSSSRVNRTLSLIVIILSGGLWLVGLLLGVILLAHLM